MSIYGTISELEGIATEMERYNYRLLIFDIDGIVGRSSLYLRQTGIEAFLREAYELMTRIENFYANIPYDDLFERGMFEQFKGLFVIKEKLPQVKLAMNSVFEERKEEALKSLQKLVGEIKWAQKVYSMKLDVLRDRIKKSR